jgi:hypothetical protein
LPYFSVIKLIGPDFHLGYATSTASRVFRKSPWAWNLSIAIDHLAGHSDADNHLKIKTKLVFWLGVRELAGMVASGIDVGASPSPYIRIGLRMAPTSMTAPAQANRRPAARRTGCQ